MIESFEDFIGIGGKRLFDQLNPLIPSTPEQFYSPERNILEEKRRTVLTFDTSTRVELRPAARRLGELKVVRLGNAGAAPGYANFYYRLSTY